MSCFGWNCQGLGTSLTVRHHKFLCGKYKPQIVFLSETKMKRVKIERIRRSLILILGSILNQLADLGELLLGGKQVCEWISSRLAGILSISRGYVLKNCSEVQLLLFMGLRVMGKNKDGEDNWKDCVRVMRLRGWCGGILMIFHIHRIRKGEMYA